VSKFEPAKIEKLKISILMPTYNDAKYLGNAIKSVLNQTHKNFELIIVDDGSDYDTTEIVETFDDNRINYLRLDENQGQLNALAKGAELVKSEYVTLLHSDDEFLGEDALQRTLSLLVNSNYQGVYADILKMNEDGEFTGTAKVTEIVNAFSPALLFLRGASNFVSDVFFVKREAFLNVIDNYITWNMPYWLKFNENKIDTLSLKKIHPWYKYRVYSENYACSDAGKFEVTNGCLRTIIEIGSRMHFPLLKVQKALAKFCSKSMFRIGPCSSKQFLEAITAVIKCYYGNIPKNAYFNALLGFYANYPSNRTVELTFPSEEKLFLGKDARRFFKMIENNCLSGFYANLLEEATQGFCIVNVTREEDYQKVKDVTRFLNLNCKIELIGKPLEVISYINNSNETDVIVAAD